MDATQWDSWTDEDVWAPTEEDERWAAEHLNDDYHDLDGDPDPWTTGDQWEADGWFDDKAGESAYLDAHEQGRKTF